MLGTDFFSCVSFSYYVSFNSNVKYVYREEEILGFSEVERRLSVWSVVEVAGSNWSDLGILFSDGSTIPRSN